MILNHQETYLYAFVFFFEWLGGKGGCSIMVSTRKGKRFPDSMSKTIPMWCCVLNRSIYNHLKRLCNTNDQLNDAVSYKHMSHSMHY